MFFCICGIWLLGLAGAANAGAMRPAIVQTVDGQSYEGTAQFTDGVLSVITTNGAVTSINFTNLQELDFDAPAHSASGASGQGTGILGVYFGKTNLDGPVIVRLDQSVNFDWGEGEPVAGIEKDYFGVIWMAEVEAPSSGEFTFSISTDDGGRLFVSDKLLAESLQRADTPEVSGKISLEAGKRYPLKLMYFDLIGNARARLYWSGPGTPKSIIPKERLFAKSFLEEHTADIRPGNGLLTTFYKNSDFTGATFTRIDTNIDFDWSGAGMPPDGRSTNFSVRWSGQLRADFSETYTFYLISDEGARLWLDNQLLINQWRDGDLSEFKETLALRAGSRYDVRLETRNTAGRASAKLLWSSPSTPKAAVPQDHLWPSSPPRAHALADRLGGQTLPGVVLRNGAFIASSVVSATPTIVRVSGFFKDSAISTVNIARLIFQPLSQAMLSRLSLGRTGLLLAKGDFVDGEFGGIEREQIKVSSVLFGSQNYNVRKEVLMAVLREVAPVRTTFQVHLRDQSVLPVNTLQVDQSNLLVADPSLRTLKIPINELSLIRRVTNPQPTKN